MVKLTHAMTSPLSTQSTSAFLYVSRHRGVACGEGRFQNLASVPAAMLQLPSPCMLPAYASYLLSPAILLLAA